MKTWHWIAALAGVAVVTTYRKEWRVGRRVEASTLSPEQLEAARDRASQSAGKDLLTGEPLPPPTGKRGRPPEYASQETKAYINRFHELNALGDTLPSRGHLVTGPQASFMKAELSRLSNDIINNLRVCDGELLPGEWPAPFDKKKYEARDRKGSELAEALAKGKPARIRGGDRRYTPEGTDAWAICSPRPGTADTGKITRYSTYIGRKGGKEAQRRKRAKKAAEEAS
jgi:hypothetical protein